MLYLSMKSGSVHQVTTLLLLLVMLYSCRGQMRNITFTASVKGLANYTRRSPSITVDQGTYVVLQCDADSPAVQIQIFRDNKILNTSHGNVQYLLEKMACSQMGTYECRGDNGENQMLDVLLNQCNPWPCPDSDIEMTMYVQVNQTVQISFCVLAYPWIMEHLFINGSRVRHSVQSPWKWDFVNETIGPIPKFNITVSRDQMVIGEYGILNISVYSSAGIKFSLNYNILLLPPGPPQCPNLVEVTGQGQSYITLSWEPGSDGGAIQSFHVYFTNNHVTWYRRDVRDGLTSVNITGLSPHVNYSFRVASSNVFRPAVNESVCENTAFGKIQLNQGSDEVNKLLGLWLVAVIFGLVGFAGLVGFLIYCYRRCSGKDNSRNMDVSPHGHDTTYTHNEEIRDVSSNLPNNAEGYSIPRTCRLQLLVKQPRRSSQDDDVSTYTHYITPASEASDSDRYINLSRKRYSDIQI